MVMMGVVEYSKHQQFVEMEMLCVMILHESQMKLERNKCIKCDRDICLASVSRMTLADGIEV